MSKKPKIVLKTFGWLVGLLLLIPSWRIFAAYAGWSAPWTIWIKQTDGYHLCVLGKVSSHDCFTLAQWLDVLGYKAEATAYFKKSLQLTPADDFVSRGNREVIVAFRDDVDKPDYFNELVCTGMVGFWPPEKMPIRVFVPNQKIYNLDLRKQVVACLSEWTASSRGKITFQLVSSAADANLTFIVAEGLGETAIGPFGGRTFVRGDELPFHVMKINDAQILLSKDTRMLPDEKNLQITILHELGHALMGHGHSCNSADVMSPVRLVEKQLFKSDWVTQSVMTVFPTCCSPDKLSLRDKQTLCRIYSAHVSADVESVLKGEASNGNRFALCGYGMTFENGWGVQRNYTKALQLYNQAAALNHGPSELKLGTMYENGRGVRQDYAKAVQFYVNAANHGCAEAMVRLGMLYEKGTWVKKNYDFAMQLYRNAVSHGSAEAEAKVGYMYHFGLGVNVDHKQAFSWYKKSADDGCPVGLSNLGVLYEQGLGVKQDYHRAFACYLQAARQGDALAESNVGVSYEEGRGVKKDYKEAISWYRRAASHGCAVGTMKLGRMYEFGHGVKQDYHKARECYSQAAANGCPVAEILLGNIYESALGVKQDYKRALACYERAAANGAADGDWCVGMFYELGRGMKQDYKKAFDCHIRAAANGCVRSMVRLGYLYESGLGVEKNYNRASGYYKQAAAGGSVEAKQRLKKLEKLANQ